tara:strand:+ start:31 stop:555 length:525 start_codon:yes stop_codon:yes gene_type:complete
MSGFNGLLDATFNPPRNWTLNESLVYNCDFLLEKEMKMLKDCKIDITPRTIIGGMIIVPKGYITDLASVPRAIWGLISPFDIARAAVVHDMLYEYINTRYKEVLESASAENGPVSKRERETYRKIADEIFKAAMYDSEPSVPVWKIYSAFWAVRAFGRWAINNSAPRKKIETIL